MITTLLALVSIASVPQATRMPPRASATASVRIVSAARIHFDRADPHFTRAAVRVDGARRPAYLVEFE
ncbi:MAG: hypothetical protein ABIR87_05755 [Sphingomicrobium sp.]